MSEIDWKSVLVRYVQAVMDDDAIVGERCLANGSYAAPDWTCKEAQALEKIHQETWCNFYGPWSPEKFWRDEKRPKWR